MRTTENVKTAFGSEVHRGKRVPFVIHPRFGKLLPPEGADSILIPACSGVRIRVQVDALYATQEAVTCSKCKGH